MGGRCYDDLGRPVDDYIKLATRSRDSVSRVEIYDYGTDGARGSGYDADKLLFVDDWSDDPIMRCRIANTRAGLIEDNLRFFFGGA